MRRKFSGVGLFIALALSTAALTAGCGGGGAQTAKSANGLRGGELPAPLAGKSAPTFDLADARDGVLKSSSLRSKPYAVTFLYTQCPDLCPLIAQELRVALEQLGQRAEDVNVVGVSVDPKGDTRASAVRWLKRHRLPANFHYLIGSQAQLRPIWKNYFAVPQVDGRPDTTHHASDIWFVDREGKWRARIAAGATAGPARLANEFRGLL